MAFATLDESLLITLIVEAVDYYARYSSGSLVRLDYKRIEKYLRSRIDIKPSYAYIIRTVINNYIGLGECEVIGGNSKEREKRLYRRDCVIRKLEEFRRRLA